MLLALLLVILSFQPPNSFSGIKGPCVPDSLVFTPNTDYISRGSFYLPNGDEIYLGAKKVTKDSLIYIEHRSGRFVKNSKGKDSLTGVDIFCQGKAVSIDKGVNWTLYRYTLTPVTKKLTLKKLFIVPWISLTSDYALIMKQF